MSFFDNALKDSVPGGDLATPIAIAAGALLLHHFMGGKATPAPAPAPAPAPQADAGSGGFLSGGGLLGGLGGLISKLETAGAGSQVGSWVGTGANQPIAPTSLGSALGPDVIAQLSARTGLNQQQILDGLAQVLPQLVNNLTPHGRLPTPQEAQYGR